MLKVLIAIIVIIALTILIVKLIDKFVPKKIKPAILVVLWILIAVLGYQTFMSVYGVIEFNKVKEARYNQVIEKLIDVRDAQLAHRTVTGQFANNWDNLVRFIDTAEFTITQRRDSSVIDAELTRRYGGVETYKDVLIIDTLGTVPVKDSLFGADPRYKTIMDFPAGAGAPDSKFELKAGVLEQNELKIPVFEVRAPKKTILWDRDANLVANEEEVVSVDGVNGDAIKVGSMDEVNTNGNWPKNYSQKQ